MKILLLSILLEKNAILTEEIGLCSIAAYLEKEGCEVYLDNTTRTYIDYQKIIDLSPDIIAIPMYSTTEKIIYDVCSDIKKALPKCKFIIGGYWPTLYAKELLGKYPIYDYAVIGEGEISFTNLIKAIENGKNLADVKGIAYRSDNVIKVTEREKLIKDLDTLPFPKRDLLENNKLKYAYISTSRGCIANCTFCWHQKFWNTNKNNRWRGRSPENIIEEIKQIVEKYNVNRFWFIDDSFEDSNDKSLDRMMKICQLIIEEELNITFETYFRAEVYRNLSTDKIDLLIKAGLVGVIIGIESGNISDLKLYNKVATLEDNYKVVEFFRSHGIAVDIGFINFNPYSTVGKLRENIKYLEKTKFASVLYYLVERCGITEFSSIYYKIKQDGLLIKEEEIGCYAYNYVDEKIGKLSDYLYYKYHANENSKVYFYAKKIGSVIREEFKLIYYIKRNFISNLEVVNSIKKHEQKYWNLLNEINGNNAIFFNEMLDLVEVGWNYKKAEEISEKYLSLDYVKGISDQLEKNRIHLYIELKHLGIDPDSYFNFV